MLSKRNTCITFHIACVILTLLTDFSFTPWGAGTVYLEKGTSRGYNGSFIFAPPAPQVEEVSASLERVSDV